MRRHSLLTGALIALAAVFLLSLPTTMTTIASGEKGIITRFGRIIATRGPGLHIGLPWGIDRVHTVKINKSRPVEIGYSPNAEEEFGIDTPEGQLLTGDYNLLNIRAVVRYVVRENEVEKYYFQKDRADALIALAAGTLLTEWVASRTYDRAFKTGKLTVPDKDGAPPLRDLLKVQTQARIEPFQLGVAIESASIEILDPPSEVKDAYDAVTRAEIQIKTKEHRAKQYANSVAQANNAEVLRILSEAEVYGDEQKLLAEADANNFEKQLSQYRLLNKVNPYYLNVIWWDRISRLYKTMKENGRIDVLDHHLANGGLDITTMPALPKG